MTLHRLIRLYFLMMFPTVSLGIAGTVSYLGSFTTANDVFLQSVVISEGSIVTVQTLSYGGGTNAAGTVILPGGFDPIVTMFDSTGQFLDENDDGTCPPATEDNGNCFDSSLNIVLNTSGTYLFALTVAPNFAAGSTLADGFYNIGDFAGRSQDYAVDVTVSPINDVPEPSERIPTTVVAIIVAFYGLTNRLRLK